MVVNGNRHSGLDQKSIRWGLSGHPSWWHGCHKGLLCLYTEIFQFTTKSTRNCFHHKFRRRLGFMPPGLLIQQLLCCHTRLCAGVRHCPLRWATSHRQCQQKSAFHCLSLTTVAGTTREHPVPLIHCQGTRLFKTYAKMPRHCWDEELECHVPENTESPILNPTWAASLTSSPAGRRSFFGSYKWSSPPTAQPQCWQRRLYGKWTPLFSSVRRSRKQTKQRALVQTCCLCSLVLTPSSAGISILAGSL